MCLTLIWMIPTNTKVNLLGVNSTKLSRKQFIIFLSVCKLYGMGQKENWHFLSIFYKTSPSLGTVHSDAI